jgi:hypothetical protein
MFEKLIEGVRELLLPALALTILATLWVVAKTRVLEEDVGRPYPPAPPAMLDRAYQASADAAPAADPG